MNFLPAHDSSHMDDPTERLLRTKGLWPQEWEESGQLMFDNNTADQVEFAVKKLIAGASVIQVKIDLASKFGSKCRIKTVMKQAYKSLEDATKLPPKTARALIAAQRAHCIQGAIVDRSWAAAASMLNRAGDVAGEISDEHSLDASDLTLTVTVESESVDPPQLPPQEGHSMQ